MNPEKFDKLIQSDDQFVSWMRNRLLALRDLSSQYNEAKALYRKEKDRERKREDRQHKRAETSQNQHAENPPTKKRGVVVLKKPVEETPEYKNLSSYGKNIVKRVRERFSCQIKTILSLEGIINEEDLKRCLKETRERALLKLDQTGIQRKTREIIEKTYDEIMGQARVNLSMKIAMKSFLSPSLSSSLRSWMQEETDMEPQAIKKNFDAIIQEMYRELKGHLREKDQDIFDLIADHLNHNDIKKPWGESPEPFTRRSIHHIVKDKPKKPIQNPSEEK